ncbi:galactose oxidase-like domain-containing protein [Fulvimarina endophytica]|uniref:galactose oxidase-like domain-containing protein n=1 Tax=Fulvimarina endophytica TaxID=2293836 RepID=UPI001314960A|nr:galactose oxidase-like domain-containing protein [Fulvimarina endophytica]
MSGSWSPLMDWPIMAIHSIVMQDGRVLTFGTDIEGAQGATMYHAIYDPLTGEHQLLDHHTHTPTDIFCSAALIIPGSDRILMAGGDARPLGYTNGPVNDSNIFYGGMGHMMSDPSGDMSTPRWYPSQVSLNDGRILVIGGTGSTDGVPEIYTPGMGWHRLEGAADADMIQRSGGDVYGSDVVTTYYPRIFTHTDGSVFYFANGLGPNGTHDLVRLDPGGAGSVTIIGQLPFVPDWEAPTVMYQPDKVLVHDYANGLWTIDMTGAAPVITRVAELESSRSWSNMTVMADGRILINGGSSTGFTEQGAVLTALVWDPETNQLTEVGDEAHARLYHSSSVLLVDGTILSSGGGASTLSEHDYLDAQIYRPDYLFNADGSVAERPILSAATDRVSHDGQFEISVGDPSSISKITFVKSGAATHSFNMETRVLTLDYTVRPDGKIVVEMPGVGAGATPGSWMLFVWDKNGTPSIAEMIAVDPIYANGEALDANSLLLNGALETAIDPVQSGYTDFLFGWTIEGDTVTVLGRDQVPYDLPGEGAVALDANDGTLNQRIDTRAGQIYRLELDLGTLSAGSRTAFEVLWNGDVVARVAAPATGSERLAVTMTGTGNADKLTLRSRGEAVVVDAVTLVATDTAIAAKPFAAIPSVDLLPNFDKVIQADGSGRPSFGTRLDDRHVGTAGDDVFASSRGNDRYEGGAGGYDQVDFSGSPADYTFTRNADGSVTVKSMIEGTDRLVDIDGIWFQGSQTWSWLADLAGPVPTQPVTVDPTPVDPVPGVNVIRASAAGGYIEGTAGSDHFIGGAGNDTFRGGAGDDRMEGGEGYNQSDYDGNASDYVVLRAADDSVTVRDKATGATDTLIDIDGLWFGGEAKWYAVGDLALPAPTQPVPVDPTPVDPVPGVNVIRASAAGGYIEGTAGNDHFIGGAGNDTFRGGAGDDRMEGGEGYNQSDYDGNASDYVVLRAADDSVTVRDKATGATDTLIDIDGLWFGGEAKWYAVGDLATAAPGGGVADPAPVVIRASEAGGYLVGTDGDDHFISAGGNNSFYGGTGDDRYEGGAAYDQVDYDGRIADYDFQRSEDGRVIVTSETYGTDTLVDIDGLWFRGEAAWYAIDDAVSQDLTSPAPDVMPDHVH